MKILKVLIPIGLLVLVTSSSGQAEPSSLGLRPQRGIDKGSLENLSLLDPDRFSMSQSYSVIFLSDGKRGNVSGLYLNTIDYRFSMPISLRLEVGYLYGSSALFGRSMASEGRLVIPRFELRYQPNSYFSLRVRYGIVPYRWYSHNRLFPW